MPKISLTEHIQFFHKDKMTGLAWLVHADDSSKYSISSKECNQSLIERSRGFLAELKVSLQQSMQLTKISSPSLLEEIESCRSTTTEQGLWENES